MNPNFRFGWHSRRTLLSITRAIAPVEIGVEALDQHVVSHIEQQIRCFPSLHRFGFILGLTFIEWGGIIGLWGLVPFSFLSREQATKRLYQLLHSRFTPARHLSNGIRVLVCLSAYGHAEVEQWFGFERRQWRKQRIQTRKLLLRKHTLESNVDHPELTWAEQVKQDKLPPTPEALYTHQDEENYPLLSWDIHEDLEGQIDALEAQIKQSKFLSESQSESPFTTEEFIEPESVKLVANNSINYLSKESSNE